MLDGLDEVDWTGLDKAYGPASELPGLLRAVASGDPELTEAAIPDGDLGVDWGLLHQSCVYPATAAVVPFLVELAGDPGVLVPDQLLGTVAWAAVFEGQSLDRPYGVRRAVATQVAALADFLDHQDPLLRVNAATALGHTDPPHTSTGALLNEYRRREPDDRVRAALLVSSVACDPGNGWRWVEDAYQDPASAVRAAAVYAAVRWGMPWTPRTTQVLHDCLIDGDPLPEGYYWFWDMRWWLGVVLDQVDEVTRGRVLHALVTSDVPAVRASGVDGADHVLEKSLLTTAYVEPVLRGLTDDPDPDIRHRARRSTSLEMAVLSEQGSWRWTFTPHQPQ